MKRMMGYREVCPFETVPKESARCSGSAWSVNRLEAWNEYREHMRLVHGINVGGYEVGETEDIEWNTKAVAAGSPVLAEWLRQQEDQGALTPVMIVGPSDLIDRIAREAQITGSRVSEAGVMLLPDGIAADTYAMPEGGWSNLVARAFADLLMDRDNPKAAQWLADHESDPWFETRMGELADWIEDQAVKDGS